jgi:hypothetical protein
MRIYNPIDWYWKSDDGRVFSSARQALISEADGGFKAFMASGGKPTRWPVDDEGRQTDAALQNVLTPYGLKVDPSAPVQKRQFSFLEFIDLFTETEQLTLVEASMTLPTIKLWYDKALGAQFIDLDDPRTEPGLQKLVDESLIASERKAAVMAGQGPT